MAELSPASIVKTPRSPGQRKFIDRHDAEKQEEMLQALKEVAERELTSDIGAIQIAVAVVVARM